MNRKFLLVSIVPALACAAFAAPALAATEEAASENWAGYVATTKDNTDYSAVSASWVQPTVTCSSESSQASYSAYWVGLGGGDSNSDALEQIGTQADCDTTGSARYYAWYELVPSAPVKLDLTINAGDTVWARTAVSGDNVSFYIKDRTTGQVWQKTLTMTAATPDTSTAEWVAEAPSECASGPTSECTPLPLADFGTAKFAQAYATSSGKVGSITDARWSATAIELEPSSSSVFGSGPGGYGGESSYGYSSGGSSEYSSYSSADSEGAAPTALSDKGTTFSVKYGASLSTDTQSSGTGQTQGESSGDGSSTYGYGGGYGGSSAYGDSSGDGYGDSYGYGDTSGYGGDYGYSYYWSDGGSGY
jgi:Peptidase A4 family